ncbi:hypothetical protein LNP00_00535 [Fructobacillus sp. M158]|nr:hypothetical protein [Fructobacillus parabroussonetiae]MCK8616858.1 hypothetical protein [Fructobacillus parabroussonetiae]
MGEISRLDDLERMYASIDLVNLLDRSETDSQTDLLLMEWQKAHPIS